MKEISISVLSLHLLDKEYFAIKLLLRALWYFYALVVLLLLL